MGAWLLDLARRTAQDWTALALLVANAIAVTLAFFYPPITMSLLFLYWAECVVIGVMKVVEFCFINDERINDEGLMFKIFLSIFHFLHYALFVFFLFILLYLLARAELRVRGMQGFDEMRYFQGFLLPVAVIAAMHVASFFRNFLGKREYEGRTLEQQVFRPYKRVGAMIGIAFVGGFIVTLTGVPELTLLLIVPFKVVADLDAHFRDHERSQERGELRLL
jgi:hypothetical protein